MKPTCCADRSAHKVSRADCVRGSKRGQSSPTQPGQLAVLLRYTHAGPLRGGCRMSPDEVIPGDLLPLLFIWPSCSCLAPQVLLRTHARACSNTMGTRCYLGLRIGTLMHRWRSRREKSDNRSRLDWSRQWQDCKRLCQGAPSMVISSSPCQMTTWIPGGQDRSRSGGAP